MKTGKNVNYIDKKAFMKDIVEYKELCEKYQKLGKSKPKIPDKIALNFNLIAENTAKKPCYNKYTWKDIMVSDAIENMIRYFDNFDVNHPKANPFGYFTQFAVYAFSRRIHIENTELYTKYKTLQQSGIMGNPEYDESMSEDGQCIDVQMYDNINEFIRKYEENMKKSKTKSKEVKKKKEKGIEKFI